MLADCGRETGLATNFANAVGINLMHCYDLAGRDRDAKALDRRLREVYRYYWLGKAGENQR